MATRVLVVDDHPGFRLQVRLMLQEAGYAVVGEAGDATSAIRAARRLAPDVVLVDVNLPDHDGFTVARTLSRAETAPAVVLTSAREERDFGKQVATCGALGFVAKRDLTGENLQAVLDGTGP